MLNWNIPHNTFTSKDRKFDNRNSTLEFDLPTSPESTTATFADDTAVLATNSDPAIASQTANQPSCNPKLV
jgi:hypothetical protein